MLVDSAIPNVEDVEMSVISKKCLTQNFIASSDGVSGEESTEGRRHSTRHISAPQHRSFEVSGRRVVKGSVHDFI